MMTLPICKLYSTERLSNKLPLSEEDPAAPGEIPGSFLLQKEEEANKLPFLHLLSISCLELPG